MFTTSRRIVIRCSFTSYCA